MQGNRRHGTVPEAAVRRILHRRGRRFFKDRLVRAGTVRTHPDILFPRAQLAVYIDGCFWHRCPIHATDPKTNAAYWQPKLEANVARDRRATAALRDAGWTVLRFWAHEDPERVAGEIERVLDAHPASAQRAPRR